MKHLIPALALLVASGTTSASERVTVLLDWFVNPDHAQLILARELGFFADAGLEVELVEPADPSLPPKMVAAGKVDIAVTYQPQLHVQVAEGLPLSRIATLVPTPLNSLVVLEDGPIKSVADLQGRKIGYSVGGFEDALLGTMLDKYDLTLADVELVNVNFSLSPSLLTGQVDAVIGAFRNFELNQMDIEGRPGRAFYPRGGRRSGIRRTDTGCGQRTARGCLRRSLCWRAGKSNDLPDQPSRQGLDAVQGKQPGGTRQRTQSSRLARHPATSGTPAGSGRCRSL